MLFYSFIIIIEIIDNFQKKKEKKKRIRISPSVCKAIQGQAHFEKLKSFKWLQES